MSVSSTTTDKAQVAVQLRGLSRSFGATRAMTDVTLDVRAGEVLAMVGANGAGKSTLNKVLCGVVAPDEGEILIDGVAVELSDPLDAQGHGIQAVHQRAEDWTVPGLTVAENLTLDRLARGDGGWRFSPRRTEQRAAAIAETLAMQLPVGRLGDDVSRLGVHDRQMIALARAVSLEPRLLILDEPTSALSAAEANRLFEVVLSLREQGVAILYVSHRLGEVDALADRVGVMRDGRLVEVFERPFTRGAVVSAMLGQVAAEISHEEQVGDRVRVSLRGAQVFADSRPFDLDLRAGEITGITGLIGAGKTEMVGALFGLRPLVAGEVTLDSEPLKVGEPGDAIARGVYYVPEDRHGQALVNDWSVRANMTLPFLSRLGRGAMTDIGQERRRTREIIDTLGIKAEGPEAPIASLSGGNQQKVVVGRWLWPDGRVLILDEPFRGVDIGARRDIARRVRDVGEEMVVIVVSADIDEIFEVADRVLVMTEGTVVDDMRLSEADRGRLVTAMAGGGVR